MMSSFAGDHKRIKIGNFFPTLLSYFCNYDCTHANMTKYFTILHIQVKFQPSILNCLQMLSSFVECKKSKHFPTLHSHFSNYDYGSTNYKNISFICTICEIFSFPSSTVWKWWDMIWKVKKNGKVWIFSNFVPVIFPTMITEVQIFDVYYYLLIISENFSLSLSMVKKWWPSKCSKQGS